MITVFFFRAGDYADAADAYAKNGHHIIGFIDPAESNWQRVVMDMTFAATQTAYGLGYSVSEVGLGLRQGDEILALGKEYLP